MGDQGVALRFNGGSWLSVPPPTDRDLLAVTGTPDGGLYAAAAAERCSLAPGAFIRMDAYKRSMAVASPKTRPVSARSELFRLFSEDGRPQVLALCAESELSVGELSVLLRDSQPQICARWLGCARRGCWGAARRHAHLGEAVLHYDALVLDALAEGRRLCLKDGCLARLPKVLAAREEPGRSGVRVALADAHGPPSPEHLAHFAALGRCCPAARWPSTSAPATG